MLANSAALFASGVAMLLASCVLDASGAVDAGPTEDGSSRADGTAGSRDSGATPDGAAERPTMYVQGRHLHDRCGEKVVPIGVNHPTMYVDRGGAAMSEIARTNANVVRIFWFATHGVQIAEVEDAISAAASNGMIPMLEMHDATGPGNWGNMGAIVDYWTAADAVALIQRHEQYLLVNIANEAGPARGQGYADFASVYGDAIGRMRAAGIRVPLVIDASGWGRDYQVLFDEGPTLLDGDPEHNLIFSAHLYDPMSRDQIAGVLQTAVDAELPFIVGEFANRSPAGSCGGALDYVAIISEANAREIGWLPWSWGNNDTNTWWNGDCWEFDMTRTFSYDSLERWGLEVAVTNEDSIHNTAVRPQSMVTGSCP